MWQYGALSPAEIVQQCQLLKKSPTDLRRGLSCSNIWQSYKSTLIATSWPPSASVSSLDLVIQVLSLTLLDHDLQVHTIIASKGYFHTGLDTASSASSKLLDHCFQVHLQACLIMASECISEFTRSSSSGTPPIAPKHPLQPVQVDCV
jgi:hypothetical protein